MLGLLCVVFRYVTGMLLYVVFDVAHMIIAVLSQEFEVWHAQ
jgi:hypothetical protein